MERMYCLFCNKNFLSEDNICKDCELISYYYQNSSSIIDFKKNNNFKYCEKCKENKYFIENNDLIQYIRIEKDHEIRNLEEKRNLSKLNIVFIIFMIIISLIFTYFLYLQIFISTISLIFAFLVYYKIHLDIKINNKKSEINKEYRKYYRFLSKESKFVCSECFKNK